MNINDAIIDEISEYLKTKVGKTFTEKDYNEVLEKFLVILTVSEFWRMDKFKHIFDEKFKDK